MQPQDPYQNPNPSPTDNNSSSGQPLANNEWNPPIVPAAGDEPTAQQDTDVASDVTPSVLSADEVSPDDWSTPAPASPITITPSSPPAGEPDNSATEGGLDVTHSEEADTPPISTPEASSKEETDNTPRI